MKKYLKIVVLFALGAFALYQSIYFLPLDKVISERESTQFNASAYTEKFWIDLKDQLEKAIPLEQVIALLAKDPERAFEEYSNVLGISNIRFFLVQSSGIVRSIEDDHVVVDIDSVLSVRLVTDYIFGNAVRDASGLIDVNEFSNTMHFNEVSSQINQRIVNEVLPPFQNEVKVNDKLSFVGALEMHRVFINFQDIEITPIQLQIQPFD